MVSEIKWTKRATNSFYSTVIYIENEWNESIAKKFVIKVSKTIELLKHNPKIGKIVYENKQIRAFVLSKQTTIFYRIKGSKIILISFFDNRLSPAKKRF